MEHPLIGSLDSLTLDELATKISELNKKLSIVTRMGNADLANQIRLALENYNSMYRAKSDELFKKQNNNRGTNFDDIIDIS